MPSYGGQFFYKQNVQVRMLTPRVSKQPWIKKSCTTLTSAIETNKQGIWPSVGTVDIVILVCCALLVLIWEN